MGKKVAEMAKEVVRFYSAKTNYDNVKKDFEALKKTFYTNMKAAMPEEDTASFVVNEDTYKVKKVSKTTVVFNPDKLAAKLSKETRNKVIIKTYEIVDIRGLVEYLKPLGVDPAVLRKFLNITTTVDEAKLNDLSEVGEITDKDIEGCYEATTTFSHFLVSKIGKE